MRINYTNALEFWEETCEEKKYWGAFFNKFTLFAP